MGNQGMLLCDGVELGSSVYKTVQWGDYTVLLTQTITLYKMGKNYKADNSVISLRFSWASEFPWFLLESGLAHLKAITIEVKREVKREKKKSKSLVYNQLPLSLNHLA